MYQQMECKRDAQLLSACTSIGHLLFRLTCFNARPLETPAFVALGLAPTETPTDHQPPFADLLATQRIAPHSHPWQHTVRLSGVEANAKMRLKTFASSLLIAFAPHPDRREEEQRVTTLSKPTFDCSGNFSFTRGRQSPSWASRDFLFSSSKPSYPCALTLTSTISRAIRIPRSSRSLEMCHFFSLTLLMGQSRRASS